MNERRLILRVGFIGKDPSVLNDDEPPANFRPADDSGLKERRPARPGAGRAPKLRNRRRGRKIRSGRVEVCGEGSRRRWEDRRARRRRQYRSESLGPLLAKILVRFLARRPKRNVAGEGAERRAGRLDGFEAQRRQRMEQNDGNEEAEAGEKVRCALRRIKFGSALP
jgi:hypothetical protein